MKRLLFSLILYICCSAQFVADAQSIMLADFENGSTGMLKINTNYDSNLFSVTPRVRTNPAKTGINTSNRCLYTMNVANAGWWKNFLILDLKQPVTITDENRILSLLCYRSIQPKDMRICINSYEEKWQLFQGKLSSDGEWERLTLDMRNFAGETLKSIYIILSCNWSDPTSGWDKATYLFDDITLSAVESLPKASVTIDASIKKQTMQDFGASDCWSTEFVSDYFSESEKTKAAKWLFSKQMDADGNPEGIGLSCWRVNVGAGSVSQGDDSNIAEEIHRTECFLSEDGTYDWTRCDGQQWFMQQAKEYGVEHFVLFSNSPPIYYTITGKANTNGRTMTCNLRNIYFDEFAEFLASTAQHFADEGYNITYISPVNEPQYDWKDNQEGAPWENTDITKLAKRLDKSIRNRELSTKILIPEAGSWYNLYAGTNAHGNKQLEAFFKRSNTTTYIGNLASVAKAVAGHSYWSCGTNETLKGVRETARAKADEFGVDIIQTEWSMLDDDISTETGFPESYAAASKMDIALYMGKVIHCDLTFGNMTSWSYWTAFSQEKWGQKNRFHLIRLNATSDIGDESNADIKEGGIVTADKNLWVLGNYSRFIRPGYQRVEMSGADEMNALIGSAWLSPEADTLVAVFVNMDKGSREVNLSLPGVDVGDIKAFVTDRTHNLQLDSSLNDATNLKLPSRSVVTVVMTSLENPDGLADILETKPKHDDRIWLLNGLQARQPLKGVYIKNGQKHISR